MKRFKDYRATCVNEAVKASDTHKVAKLITNYLKKKLGQATLYPAIEQFKRGADMYTTVTVLLGYPKSVRFNWLHGKIDQNTLHSVTIDVEGKRQEILFDKEVSLVQTLPQVVKVLQHKVTTPEAEFYLEDYEEVKGVSLNEAKGDHPLEVIKSHIDATKVGDKIPVSSLGLTGLEYKLIRQLTSENPKAFDGYRILNKNAINWSGVEATLANSKVKMTIKSDNTKESWVKPSDIDESEGEEAISYIEKVADLANMIRFMLKGATNAVFCAGRGGTGKTQTIEDTLAELGKSDGNGYFKVTSSASPAAVYEILYKNKKGMIMFDDCDGALDSQDGRNLIKAATDTKHVRKVSWAKKGSNYYDPEHDGERDDGEDGGFDDRLPRHFEFLGKVIFISNLSTNKLDPDGALRTRAMMIELSPTNMEIYEYMQIIYKKIVIRDEEGQIREMSEQKRREVVMKLKDIIAKKPENTVNLRFLVRALCLAGTGLDGWERMLAYS